MRSGHLFLLGIIGVLIFTSLVFSADVETFVSCGGDEDCNVDPELAPLCQESSCTCDVATSFCTILEGTPVVVSPPANETVVNQTALEELVKSIATLETMSITTDERVAALEQNLLLVQQQLAEFGSSIEALNVKQSQEKESLKKDVSTVATGLAGLQKEVGGTQEDIQVVEQDLEKVQRFRERMIMLGFTIVVLGTAGGIWYYLQRKRTDPAVIEYITKLVKQGKKFAQIQELLRKAGWSDEDVKKAYRETMKKNYEKYQQSTGKRPAANQQKVALLAGLGIFLIVGIIGSCFLQEGRYERVGKR